MTGLTAARAKVPSATACTGIAASFIPETARFFFKVSSSGSASSFRLGAARTGRRDDADSNGVDVGGTNVAEGLEVDETHCP